MKTNTFLVKSKTTHRKCFVCQEHVGVYGHHIKPVANGGDDNYRNIVYLCDYHHNELEGKQYSDIFFARKEYLEIKSIYDSHKKRFRIIGKHEIVEWSRAFNEWRLWKKEKFGLVSEPFDIIKNKDNLTEIV